MDGDSFLDLGAVVPSHMKDPSNLYMMDILKHDTHWTQKITGVGFGDMRQNSYEISADVLFDTGSSCILVPDAYYFWFLEKLGDKGMAYYSDNGSRPYLQDCSVLADLPIIYFLIGGYWFQADPLDYVLPNSFTCPICISRSPVDGFILGDAFLRNYYIVHNLSTL